MFTAHPIASPDASAPTGAASPPPPPAVAEQQHEGEPFWSVVVRRTRYVVAVVVTGLIFWHLAWVVAAPPAGGAGVSLLAYGTVNPGVAAAVLLVMLLAAVAVSMVICHPDSPHTGLYCALLGLAALSIRGGPIDLLLRSAEVHLTDHGAQNLTGALFKTLALETLLWTVLLIIAELFTWHLWQGFFANAAWIGRSGLDPSNLRGAARHALSLRGSLQIVGGQHPPKLGSWLGASAAAFVLCVALAMILVSILMQSQVKGQVLFAIYVGFALAAFGAHYAFPAASRWAFWLAVPGTAILGYLLAPAAFRYPEHAAGALARALPIDYLAVGIPGVIFGYYTSLRFRLHQAEEDADQA